MKKLIVFLLLFSVLFGLCGCSSAFEKEYVHISEYSVPEQTGASEDGKTVVRNINALKQAILDIVYSENGKGTISFDPSYEGDAVEDMASACWQVRTQDAMCAYCVDNIAYEMNKIVSYYEAELSVTYSDVIEDADGIVRMNYATKLDEEISQAISNGRKKLAILVGRSSYNAEGMVGVAEKLYRTNPYLAPHMPVFEVNMFSGNTMQKLYEININYGLSDYELRNRRDAVQAVKPFEKLFTESLEPMEKALLVCDYLVENCVYQGENAGNSVHSALVGKDADSEGLSYAFVELCRQLGLNSRMIYGQQNWQDHWWNLVEIGGKFYHVDVSLCMDGEYEDGFLLNDQMIWATHRWDVSSYPTCDGEPVYGVEEIG